MKNNLIKYLILAFSVIVVFGSCRKDDYEGTQTEGNGKSFVRIADSKLKNNFFDAFTDKKTVSLFSIKKDAANNADLNKATTVTLTDLGSAYFTKYNKEHKTNLEVMPTSVYTIGGNVASTSGGVTVSFPAGSFQEKFIVTLDGSKLDPAKKYALAYVISDAQGLTTKVGRDTIITTVGVKNQYDGVYALTGTITRFTAGTSSPDTELGGDYPTDDPFTSEMVTLSGEESTFQLFWKTGGGIAGVDGLQVSVDPTTNKATVTAPGSPGSVLANTPGEPNYYDPATKTFHLHFTWGAVNKRIANITLKRIGGR